MKIPSGGWVGMVNSPLVTLKSISIHHEWLRFVTRGEFIVPTTSTIPTPPPEGIEAISYFKRSLADQRQIMNLAFKIAKF